MKRASRYYGRSIVLTVIVFMAMFFLLIISLRLPRFTVSKSSVHEEIVQAVGVDQQKVQEQIQKIKAEEEAKKQAEILHQKKLSEEAQAAKTARIQEQKHLAQLKSMQEKMQREQKVAELAAQQKIIQMQKELKDMASKKEAQQKQAEIQKALTIKKQRELQAQKDLQKQIDDEQQKMNTVQQRQTDAVVDKYKALILDAIGRHWIMPTNVNKQLSTVLLIHLAPGGMVLNVSVLTSSGNDVLDRSVVAAVWKASPLPVPNDADAFSRFRDLKLTVRPEGLLGN